MVGCAQANFSGKRHELNVSTYQMCILLLFNEADRLSYGDIREATQITPAELKRNLQSLACVKVWGSHEDPRTNSDDLLCRMSSQARWRSAHAVKCQCTEAQGQRNADTPACRFSNGPACHVSAGCCMPAGGAGS